MVYKGKFLETCILIVTLLLLSVQSMRGYKLKSVSVLFRHGDRVPDEIYPNEKYTEKTFYPIPLGGLTNMGKRREYDLGKFLRMRYNGLLGDLYIPSEIYARSTGYDRAQMSLLLVLAGLYPPKKEQRWDLLFNWQPIPIEVVPFKNDPFMAQLNCPAFLNEFNRTVHTPLFRKDITSNPMFEKYVKEYMGQTGDLTIYDVAQVYTHVYVLESLKLKIPDWTKLYYPKGLLQEMYVFTLETMGYSDRLTRLSGGSILKTILNNMMTMKKAGQKPKLFLYSAHDITIVPLLNVLKLYKPHTPKYSSAVIFEEYEMKEESYIKILYFKGIPKIIETMTIPHCTQYCPLKDILNMFSDQMSGDYENDCKITK